MSAGDPNPESAEQPVKANDGAPSGTQMLLGGVPLGEPPLAARPGPACRVCSCGGSGYARVLDACDVSY
jgi:hypothetical protein